MVNARFAPPGITNDLARLRKELRLTRVSEVELRIGATAEEQLQSLGRVFLKTQFVRQGTNQQGNSVWGSSLQVQGFRRLCSKPQARYYPPLDGRYRA